MVNIVLFTAVSAPYLPNPELIDTLPEGGAIWGMTVLNDELFVVRRSAPQVEVYDADTLTMQRHLVVNELVGPNDMTSCAKNNCLYISDGGYKGRNDQGVHKVHAQNVPTKWSTTAIPVGLSVTSESGHVIVTCRLVRLIVEYTSDGEPVREICLPVDVTNPYHSVMLPGGQFVVCHGDVVDQCHRVVVVGDNGTVLRQFGGVKGRDVGELNSAVRLVVDGNDFIFVADHNNKRILLLSTALDGAKELVSRQDNHRPWKPRRLCLDVKRQRLYVAECLWDGQAFTIGEVLVFKVKNV